MTARDQLNSKSDNDAFYGHHQIYRSVKNAAVIVISTYFVLIYFIIFF